MQANQTRRFTEIFQSRKFNPNGKLGDKGVLPGDLTISNYLNEIYEDWQDSREEFPHNTYPPVHGPIPFFRNPATARVATIRVNPSSNEVEAGCGWPAPTQANRGAWKRRLKSYFNHATPAVDWFEPWRIGLALLDCSYEVGTAAHFDVSCRP